MKPVSRIGPHLESQGVRLVESTIPGDMTIAEWRTQRRHKRPASAQECGHLQDTTTRYDHEQKLLHFLMVCPTCGNEKLIETQPYEPRFTPHAQPEPEGATIHQLPIRRPVVQPLRRAA
jgi:hypothetical protein